MKIDMPAALSFMATHGRILDRRRLQALLGQTDASDAFAALDAYRNPDGGYGWGLEPDLRCAESQPAAAMHALEVFAENATTTPRAAELCDWLEAHTLADGGVPIALPIADPAGCAPFWAEVDSTISSLQMTSQVAANAHRGARHDPVVARHLWLARATEYCLDAIDKIHTMPHAYEFLFSLWFLDAAYESSRGAQALLDRLGQFLPEHGSITVDGGTGDEQMHPLDFAPRPGRPIRALFTAEAIEADLKRLAGMQQPDGGWVVDFGSFSPIAELEWRGYATVQAVEILRSNAP